MRSSRVNTYYEWKPKQKRFFTIHRVLLIAVIFTTISLITCIIWLIVTHNLSQVSIIIGTIANTLTLLLGLPLLFLAFFQWYDSKTSQVQDSPFNSDKQSISTQVIFSPRVHTSNSLLEPPQIPSLWNIPYRRNPLFTGRQDLLAQIHDQFNQQAEAHYQHALEIHKKVFGLHHPTTIKTLEDFASFLRKTERADEASLLEASVKIQK